MVSLLRALDRTELSTEEWIAEVAIALRKLRRGRVGCSAFRFEVRPDYSRADSWSVVTGEEFGLDIATYLDSFDRDQLRFFSRPQRASGMARAALLERADVEDLLDRDLGRVGASDLTYLCVCDGIRGVCIHVPTISNPLTRQQADLLASTATQLDTSLRLRTVLDGELPNDAALLTPSGDVLAVGSHLAAHTPLPKLREVLAAREDSRRDGDDPDRRARWIGLVDGEWSFVDLYDRDGRRNVVVARTPPELREVRRLDERERQVVEHVSRGGSSKEIGLTLGLSEATVARILARGLSKLGLASRADLVRVRAIFD